MPDHETVQSSITSTLASSSRFFRDSLRKIISWIPWQLPTHTVLVYVMLFDNFIFPSSPTKIRFADKNLFRVVHYLPSNFVSRIVLWKFTVKNYEQHNINYYSLFLSCFKSKTNKCRHCLLEYIPLILQIITLHNSLIKSGS